MNRIQLADFAKCKSISKVRFSPNGQHITFAVHQAHMEQNKYLSNLWLYDDQAEKIRQLTTCNQLQDHVWQKDSQAVVFSSNRPKENSEAEGKENHSTQFFEISIHGGEAKPIFSTPMRVQSILLRNDKQFIFTARKPVQEEDKQWQSFSRLPFWFNGAGFLPDSPCRLYLFNTASQVALPLTDEGMEVEDFVLNESRNQVLLTGRRISNQPPINNAVYLYSFINNRLTALTDEDGRYEHPIFLPDHQVGFHANYMQTHGLNENGRFFRMSLDDKTIQQLAPDFDYCPINSVGSDCKFGGANEAIADHDSIYFVSTQGGSAILNKLDERGVHPITETGSTVDCFDVHQGRVVYAGQKGLQLQELYLQEDASNQQISYFNRWLGDDRTCCPPEPLQVETEAGVWVEGWVIKPADYQDDQSYPGILSIHGGPKTVYGSVFFHEMQLLAAQGFFVFYCNPRGSDGGGSAFADIRGRWGQQDYQDILKFTDAVLEKHPAIDQDRLGVTGGSYGGFMVNWIIGHSDRFRAAITQRCLSNWTSMVYTSDIGYMLRDDQMSADAPMDQFWQCSPVRFAHQVNTPTLVIHSTDDYRCPLSEGLQMFTALQLCGVESKLVVFKGENHELSRSGKPKARLERLREIGDWFVHHLKPADKRSTTNESTKED